MRKPLTLAAGVLVAGILSPAAASAYERVTANARAVPVDEVLTVVNEMGLAPSTRVRRRGDHYVVHAFDPHGVEVRVVADARSGTILSVNPLHGSAVEAPRHFSGPRIIQVPQADEDTESTVIHDRSATPAPRANRKSRAAPPRVTSVPPPPARRRTMLNVPREKDRALTPTYPTPRFDTGAEAGEKFELHGGEITGDALPPSAD